MRARGAAVLAALAVAAAGVARAEEEPGTRLGVLVGLSEQSGALGSRYGLGFTFGVEAAWIPTWVGVVWAVSYSRFLASGAGDPAQTISLWDLGIAVRGRAVLRQTGVPIFGYGQLGVDLVRSSIGLPPDASSAFLGPKVGVGLELRWARFFFGAEADYGLLTGGPSGLSLLGRAGIVSL